MLIKKVSQLSSDTNLAIMFQFIEEDVTKIEISLDGENWRELDFQGDKSDVYIFQGFKELDFVNIYYRYTQENNIYNEKVTMRTDFKNKKIKDVEANVPKDFRKRNKRGNLIPNPLSIDHCMEEV